MTADELQEIRERCAEVTDGPWSRQECDVYADGIHIGFIDMDFEQDVDFLFHARTDIPNLLAEIGRLTNEIEQLRNTLTRIRDVKSRDHVEANRRLVHIDNMACQALGGDFMTDVHVDEENQRLRDILYRFVIAFAVGDAGHLVTNGRSWSALEDAEKELEGATT